MKRLIRKADVSSNMIEVTGQKINQNFNGQLFIEFPYGIDNYFEEVYVYLFLYDEDYTDDINPNYDGYVQLGSINWEYQEDEEILIGHMDTEPKYQNKGVGDFLFEKFCEIYTQNYNNEPISVSTGNPVVEYMFAKAVSNGLLPEQAFVDNFQGSSVNRYQDWEDGDGRKTIIDLRNKLPEDFKNKFFNN